MSRSIIARGKFKDPLHIELAEPVPEIGGEVEVSIRQLAAKRAQDIFDVVAAIASGSRSKADIDRQIQEERGSWDKR